MFDQNSGGLWLAETCRMDHNSTDGMLAANTNGSIYIHYDYKYASIKLTICTECCIVCVIYISDY